MMIFWPRIRPSLLVYLVPCSRYRWSYNTADILAPTLVQYYDCTLKLCGGKRAIPYKLVRSRGRMCCTLCCLIFFRISGDDCSMQAARQWRRLLILLILPLCTNRLVGGTGVSMIDGFTL